MELAELQDREVGDGTTSVVIIAAELLKVNASSMFLVSDISEFTFCFLRNIFRVDECT